MTNINQIPTTTMVNHHFARQHFGSSTFKSQLLKSRLSMAKSLYKRDLLCHYGCVNAIEFSREGKFLTSGGDDRRVLLWDLEKSIVEEEAPTVMLKQHLSNIFTLGFDSKSTRIFSGGNDDIVIVHDILTGDCLDVFYHLKPVYGLSVSPNNDNVFTTAGDDGRILLFDLRASNEQPNVVVRYRAPFHSVMFHPVDDNFLITANAKEGIALWDVRAQRMPVIRYGGEDAAQSCMSVRFNSSGNLLLALRRRLPPILYSTLDPTAICQFYNQDYYNSCTMKSCTFAGTFDEYVLSGSDDFNLYVWRIADVDFEQRQQWVDKNQMVLYGHRSIVNQVRWNDQRCMLASSGVEKVIKLWTPFELKDWSGSLTEETPTEPVREVFTHDEYVSLNMTHDYSNQNTLEDHRMIAFFDYLVQQEFEEWSSSNQNSDHTSENSSRPDPTSDTEPTRQHETIPERQVRQNRRGEPSSQRHKYRNRIAYLIATKRKTLKRLALKKVARYSRRTLKNKFVPRQTKRAVATRPIGRKWSDKKMRRLSVQSKYKKPVSHEQTSDSEVPQKKKRRTQSAHLLGYRSFRRKATTPLSSASNTSTRVADKSDSSSEYDDRATDPRQGKSSTSAPVLGVDVPSTSTGITGSGKGFMFRISNFANDSDESIPDSPTPTSDNRTLRVLRSPTIHNNHRSDFSSEIGGTGTQRSLLSSTFRQQSRHTAPPSNGRYKQQEDDYSSIVEDYASTFDASTTSSNSLASSDNDDSSNSDFYAKRRKIDDEESVGNVASTPPDSGNSSLPTPSSSISTRNGPSSSTLEIVKRNFRNNARCNLSSDDDSD